MVLGIKVSAAQPQAVPSLTFIDQKLTSFA
jgi:hypothetical protein